VNGKHLIDFEEPFCDLGDKKTSVLAATGLARSLVLYYFLATGYITELGSYKLFWVDFKKACGWIAKRNGQTMPQPCQVNPVPSLEDEVDAKFSPASGKSLSICAHPCSFLTFSRMQTTNYDRRRSIASAETTESS
jgi:hypothetical protein